MATWRISREPPDDPREAALFDAEGEAWARYGAVDGTVILVRPDGYVLGRWVAPGATVLAAAVAPFHAATGSKNDVQRRC